ncbi:MAG: PaaI family thioesterase [Gammaproteobacteria bacterium]
MVESDKVKAIRAYCKYKDSLPNTLGISLETVGDKTLSASIGLADQHLNQSHASFHAATIVALADTACGWGCIAHLPENAVAFTTLELNCNLLRAETTGLLTCDATMLHGGRTTQVWGATVRNENSTSVATFRCTELILY